MGLRRARRRIDSCTTQLKAPGPSRTFNESKEEVEEEGGLRRGLGFGAWGLGFGVWGLEFGVWDLRLGVLSLAWGSGS